MRLLITGGNGLLGSNLIRHFTVEPAWEVVATSLSRPAELPPVDIIFGDLADPTFVRRLVDETKPDMVINTVALVDIDKCENDPDLAKRVNVATSENLAKAISGTDGRLIHISTDHLFGGDRSFYTEDDRPAPVNNYGRTKLEAETVCLQGHPNTVIVRTNFYGWSPPAHKSTFGEWLYDSLKQKQQINLFTNYYFTPIDIGHLAQAIEVVAKSDFVGILNIAGSQRCSKYEFGAAMAKVFDFDLASVTPSELDLDSFTVSRQPDLSLDTTKFAHTFDMSLPDLEAGLGLFRDNKPQGR